MVIESLFLFLVVLELMQTPAYSLCPLPPMVTDAVSNTVHDNLNGNYIEYTCIKGYYIGHGDSHLKCSNGTISGILPSCMRKRCQSLSPGPRVHISNYRTEYGSMVWVKCEQGYKMSSTNSVQLKVTCIDGGYKTGKWSSSMPVCSLITCSNCMSLDNGQSNCNSSLTYNYNSTVEYWCDSGYNAYGSNILRCGGGGSWINDDGSSKMNCYASKIYVGCYIMENTTSSSTTKNDCRYHCQTNGYHYAGVNNGGCACRNSLTTPATDQCKERCNINGKVTCGGVDNIRTSHYSFYGCYSDPGLQMTMVELPADSTKTCIEYCRLKNTRYALLFHSDRCGCTNIVSKTATLVQNSRCQYRNYTDVYFVRIVELEKTYLTCDALYKAGVRYHGEYILGQNITRCNFKDGTPCDHQWIGYRGVCYHFNPDGRTFWDSLKYCASLNSDLVSIHDLSELQFLTSSITEFQDLKDQVNWFIGLYDNLQSYNYIWSDGTLKVWLYFKSGYPSKNNYPCVYLTNTGWIDANCQQLAGLICKKKQDSNQCLKLTNPISESKYFTQSPNMNPGLCFQTCRGLKLAVSAVNDVTCRCYSTLPTHSVLNWTNCTRYCSPNAHQNCGGNQNIFFVTKESGQPAALSCYELQLQGMANFFTTDSAGVPLCNANETNSCPPTWLGSLDSCYKFFESNFHFNDAVKQCAKNNAYVVSINDADEENRLVKMIQKMSMFKNYRWSIGLTNEQKLGVFRWSDGQPVTYNKVTSVGYYYVTWIPSNKQWYTSSTYRPFICEKNSVFSGCYNDVIKESVVATTADMTVNMCVELCRGRIKKYALLEGYNCYCSDTVTNKTSCRTTDTCKAQPNQLCGKSPVVAAYQVDQFKKFANNCQDLLFEGISIPTVYVLGDKRKNCDFKGNIDICPADTRPWIGFDGECYLLNEAKTWVQAQNYCLSIGSTLASIKDDQQLEFLVKSIKPRYTMTYKSTVWLGGSDEVYEGFYNWVDGNLLSKKQSQAIGTGHHHYLALVKPTYTLKRSTETIGYSICQITKDYRGCFQIPAILSPNITILITSENLVSVNLCKQLCLGRNFKYSLTNQKTCACTNSTNSLISVDKKRCQNPCPSENLLSCGSQDTSALHILDDSRLVSNCSQLAINGIFLNATYKLWNATTNSTELKQCGQADNSSCPIGWIGKDNICYYFSTRKTSLSEARRTCFSKSAILSFPINAVARKFIVDTVNSVPTIWHLGKFFVSVQTFNRSSYVVVASGKIIKREADIQNPFNQLLLTWNNIFSKSTSTSEYFICEKFSGYKGCAILSHQQQTNGITIPEMTATQCLEFCRGQEFLIAAVNITSCFCLKTDNALSWQSGTSTNWCSQSCPGFDNQPCGGNSVFSIYEADPNDSLPDSCYELANLGVTTKSTYKIKPSNFNTILKTTCFSTGGYAESIQPTNYTFTSKQSSFSTTDLRVHIFPTMSNAWRPTSVSGQWVEVALPSLYIVTGIRTRGVMKPDERWVKSYELFYGDVSPGYLAPYSENNITEANTDGNNVVTRFFRKPFVANTIRLVVKQSHLSIALGFDFLGQPYQSVFGSNASIGCFADDNSRDLVVPSASTKDECKTMCYVNSYPIYGIKEKNGSFVCKCFLNFGKYGQLNDTECHGGVSAYSFILSRSFEIGCPKSQELPQAKMTPLSNPMSGRYAYNTKVMYTCIPGYEFQNKSNSSIIRCQQNNQWELLPGNCSKKQCPAIPQVYQTTTDTNDTLFGSEVTYRCQNGFMFSNQNVFVTIECLADGKWNATVPSCIGLKCNDPSPPKNSKLVTRNNTHATFICNEGFYFMNGRTQKTFSCQQNITWAFNNNECKAPDPFQRKNSVSHGEQNKRIALPSHSLHARSLLDCISKCMQYMSCSAISQQTQSSNGGINCDLFLNTHDQLTLVGAPGWNMYYMKSLI